MAPMAAIFKPKDTCFPIRPQFEENNDIRLDDIASPCPMPTRGKAAATSVNKTLEYADRALQALDEIADAGNGTTDRETRLRALNLFAASSRIQGRLEDAELTLQIAVMEAEFSLGEDHPEVAAAWAELALVYVAMNQPAEADRVWLKAVEASARAKITGMNWPVYCAYSPAAA
jgi:hypothetical protein